MSASETGRLAPYVPRALLARVARQLDVLGETVPSTMVFADVSGFTHLSERLARQGKEGAEQLVDVINTCFSGLLAEAYSRGGSLVKFGGDAMVLMFYDQEGDQQHALRACSAAVAMRRRLREASRARAAERSVVIRMSVGIHSGDYAMFVVGGSHRELLIGGPAASTVVGLESAASAGQILVSPETAARLPRSCVGGAVGSGMVLTRAPAACEWIAPAGLPAPPGEVIANFLPAAVRDHLLRKSAAPEHRTATVAFLQYGGLDELVIGEGAANAARRLDELVRLVQEAVERYDVCFLDSDIAADGGKIRLSAGVPRVVGEDEERMLLALRHIVEAGPPLPLRVGVHRGPVFSGQVGPIYRRWYAVMGDTVNVAARLVAKAPPGRIYATRDVLRRAKTSFAQTAVEPFAVKGKSRPVQAWDVGPPVRGASDAAIRLELPLVGRSRELEVLRAAVDDARRGSGTLIEIAGETGAGKSRLLAEAGKFAADMVRLRATCEVYTRDTPYHAWREPLRALLGVRGNEAPEAVLSRLRDEIESAQPDLLPWLSLIAIVFDIAIAPSEEVAQLAETSQAAKLQEVVLRFLGPALVVPTLLEIEQAHLMDAASVALFEALARELPSSAWVVLVTRRNTPGGMMLEDGGPATRIELGPLSREATRTLAFATPEAAQLPPHVVELAVGRSGGSPEFLLDLLAAALEGDREQLPDSVDAATMARIDALDPEDGALVRRAAVLGPSFHPQRLADVLPDGMAIPDEEVWERLSAVFVREPDGLVRFRRPALQEVAYASLPFKLRRELHKAVALRLEREHGVDADAAVLSNHFALAGDHVRAQRYALIAANRATERFAHADAVALYRRAIDAGRASGTVIEPEALARAWEQMGEELRCVGEPAAASRALTEARRLLYDDPIAQARLCDRHADVASRSAALGAAVRWVKRGFKCLEGVEGPVATAWRAKLLSRLGGLRNRQGRWSEAIEVCRQAIAEAQSVGELAALAHALYSLDWALVESGRAEEATNSWQALDIYRQLGDPEHELIVLNNLGMFAYFDGRWDDALSLYIDARECGERSGRPADVAFVDCNVGEILSDQGRLEDAEEHLRRARRVWSATREPQAVAFIDMLLGRLAVRRGDYQVGVPMLERSTRELRAFSMQAYADFGRALLAEAEALGGDPARGLEIARAELPEADRTRPLLLRAAGVALARLGDASAGRRELTAALECARERRSDYEVAATIDALAALDGGDPEMLRERDEILAALKIVRLPKVAVGAVSA